ncbi:SDR family NAD(P)-dependent oxidoreductase [Roseicella aerolata]|uniref:SDR family oxidoreductase n=1 Tax=Roseicella aerolata TaxID=2883479 RepID=A0A9X1ICU2_9PROT|nr:SDR family oxidoreductase [Roseicella aerolata]MCB4822471.1 SDR family oxidoreductase [Roseicella aerolata]
MDRGLKGKAALVSGASKGIGRAIVARLVAEGMQVLGTARGGCDVPGAVGFPADLRDPAAPSAVVARAVEAFGRLDLVVNSAGATRRGDFLALDDAAWTDSYAGKFFAAMRLTRAAWPHLMATQGSVVHVAGAGGKIASADFTIGGSVNAALMNLTKALADRGVQDGVRVNCINPGSIRTDRLTGRITTVMQEQELDEAAAADALAKATGVARFGEPEEIAAVVAFLASAEAGYIQGAILDVDGGWIRAV